MLVDNSKNWSIKKSTVPQAGKGLYSKIKIPKNKVLGEYYGKRYTPDEYSNSNVDPMYVWRANDGTYVDAMPVKTGNPLRYVNAPQNIKQADWINTRVVMKNGKVLYKTTRTIRPNEELWVDYGSGYFSGSGGKPNYLKDPETGYRCDHNREIMKFMSNIPQHEATVRKRHIEIRDTPEGTEGPIKVMYWTMNDEGEMIDGGIVSNYNPAEGAFVSVYMPPESDGVLYYRFLSYKNDMSFCEKTSFVF